jgi:hypothetical protein
LHVVFQDACEQETLHTIHNVVVVEELLDWNSLRPEVVCVMR